MKHTMPLLLFFNSFYVSNISAQEAPPPPEPFIGISGRHMYNLGAMMGQPFEVKNAGQIKGSPFFIDSFMQAAIKLKNGNIYTFPKFRLNLSSNQLHFLNEQNIEMTAGEGIVQKVIFSTDLKDSNTTFIFGAGYPPVNNNNELTYYEELNQGTAKLLKLTKKEIVDAPALMGMTSVKKYTDNVNYYVYNDNHKKLMKYNRGKHFAFEIFKDKKDKIDAFIKEHSLKCNSTADILLLIKFYNTLN